MRPQEKSVVLPHGALPNADWADCWEINDATAFLTAFKVAEIALMQSPLWVRALMKARDIVVSPLGLKTSRSFSEERKIGLFPILSETRDQIVLGFDDRHLDFRIIVDVAPIDDVRQCVRITTLVHRKIFFGKLYLAAIEPFHRLIVASALGRFHRLPR